jgi:hypothetical protein
VLKGIGGVNRLRRLDQSGTWLPRSCEKYVTLWCELRQDEYETYATRASQAAVMVHWLLVLELGAHITAAEPFAVLPAPSRAVPVPRLMIW